MAGKWNLRILWSGNGCKGIHEALSEIKLIEYVHLTFTWLDPSGLKHIVEKKNGRHMVVSSSWRNTSPVIIVLGDASIP